MSLGASQVYYDSRIRRQLAANCFRQRVELRFLDYEPAALQFSSIFIDQAAHLGDYFSFAYSNLAAIRTGMSGSASFHSARKSL